MRSCDISDEGCLIGDVEAEASVGEPAVGGEKIALHGPPRAYWTGGVTDIREYYTVNGGNLHGATLRAPASHYNNIRLGVDPAGVSVGFTWEDLKSHTICVGLVGQGKTNCVKVLAERVIANGGTVTILDLEGEYSDLAHKTGSYYVNVEKLKLGLIPTHDCGGTQYSLQI